MNINIEESELADIIRRTNPHQLVERLPKEFLAECACHAADADLVSAWLGESASAPKPAAKSPAKKARKPRAAKAPAVSVSDALDGICSCLSVMESLSAAEIAKELDVDITTISKALKVLEKNGRITSTGNRRGKRYLAKVTNGATEAQA